MSDRNRQFEYLLNAFERASQSANPAKDGYAEKRRKLLAYVNEMENLLERTLPHAQAIAETFAAAHPSEEER